MKRYQIGGYTITEISASELVSLSAQHSTVNQEDFDRERRKLLLERGISEPNVPISIDRLVFNSHPVNFETDPSIQRYK